MGLEPGWVVMSRLNSAHRSPLYTVTQSDDQYARPVGVRVQGGCAYMYEQIL